MKTMYLCLNCFGPKGKRGKHFVADVPVCECGVDGRLPEYKGFVAKCVWTHYDPPHPVIRGRGRRAVLCDGRAVRGLDHTKEFSTGSPTAVTCPACLAHPSFPAADGERRVPEDGDFAI